MTQILYGRLHNHATDLHAMFRGMPQSVCEHEHAASALVLHHVSETGSTNEPMSDVLMSDVLTPTMTKLPVLTTTPFCELCASMPCRQECRAAHTVRKQH